MCCTHVCALLDTLFLAWVGQQPRRAGSLCVILSLLRVHAITNASLLEVVRVPAYLPKCPPLQVPLSLWKAAHLRIQPNRLTLKFSSAYFESQYLGTQSTRLGTQHAYRYAFLSFPDISPHPALPHSAPTTPPRPTDSLKSEVRWNQTKTSPRIRNE